MEVENFDGGTIITGPHIRIAQMIARYAKWRLMATWVVKHGDKPSKGWTIHKFNTEYQQNCKTWKDIHTFTQRYDLDFSQN